MERRVTTNRRLLDRQMVDAIREILGLHPLYVEDEELTALAHKRLRDKWARESN